MFDQKIKIKPYFSVIAHNENNIELRSGIWNHISFTIKDDTNSGQLYSIIKLLNGENCLRDIAMKTKISQSQIEKIMDHLDQLDVLQGKSETAFDYYTDLYASGFQYYKKTPDDICNQKIYILSDQKQDQSIEKFIREHIAFNPLKLLSEDAHLNHLLYEDQNWLNDPILFEKAMTPLNYLKNQLVVMVFHSVDPVVSMKFNRIALALSINWIHAAIDGPFILIGPTFEPKNTACYECFELWISMNLRENESYRRYKNALIENKIMRRSEFPMKTLLINMMNTHLSLEILNYMLTKCNFTKNRVMSIYLPSMEICFNDFLKSSFCSHCGPITHKNDHQLYFDVQAYLGDQA